MELKLNEHEKSKFVSMVVTFCNVNVSFCHLMVNQSWYFCAVFFLTFSRTLILIFSFLYTSNRYVWVLLCLCLLCALWCNFLHFRFEFLFLPKKFHPTRLFGTSLLIFFFQKIPLYMFIRTTRLLGRQE